MALNVKTILGLLVIINIVTVVYFYTASIDPVTSSSDFIPGPKRKDHDNLRTPLSEPVNHKKDGKHRSDDADFASLDNFDSSSAKDDVQIDLQTDTQIVQGDNFGIAVDDAAQIIADDTDIQDDSKNAQADQPDDDLDHADSQVPPVADVASNADDKSSDLHIDLPKDEINPPKDVIDIEKLKFYLAGDDDDTRSQADLFNPFRELGFYKDVGPEHFNQEPGAKSLYHSPHTGLIINSSYCDYNDIFNILNPSNLLDQMHFVNDYDRSLVRVLVIEKIGIDVMPQVSTQMKDFRKAVYPLDIRATMFFTKKVDFHFFHEIGRQFLCNTHQKGVSQMYNHIPGHGVITRKDYLVGSVNAYSEYYRQRSHCFSKKKFFPYAYRLDNVTECKQFFDEINDESYFEVKKKIPMNYLIKVGYNAHRASGVFLFDVKKEEEIRTKYKNGSKCGKTPDPLLAQKYIGNALLLDRHNKFDFRMYMLIASVDPLILFYHDGFLRVSLEEYDQHSTDVNVHFTNTQLSKQKIKDLNNATLAAELQDYQMWSLSRLQEYLLSTGKITDPNWLDNYLRPLFKKAYIHLIKMSHHAFYKHSSVFEMFGVDFMLDDDLGLWLIEVNGSPQLIGTSAAKEKLMVELVSDLFEIQYSYLRSKMKRLRAILQKISSRSDGSPMIDIGTVKEEFSKASKNRLEPEFELRKNISWQKILDENLPGKEAYMGILEDECILDRE